MTANLVVTLTQEEFRALVQSAIAEFLAERGASDDQPVLLDRNQLARALSCSTSTIRRLTLQGMPLVRLVDSPRWHLPSVLEWLQARTASQSDADAYPARSPLHLVSDGEANGDGGCAPAKKTTRKPRPPGPR